LIWAAPGEYAVTVVWPEQAAPGKPTFGTEPPPEAPDRLKGRYANRAKSGLSAVVKPGKNQLPPFELKKPGGSLPSGSLSFSFP